MDVQVYTCAWMMQECTIAGGTTVVNCHAVHKITGSDDNTARVWNVATGECVHVLRGHIYELVCAAVHGTTYVLTIN